MNRYEVAHCYYNQEACKQPVLHAKPAILAIPV